MNFRRFLPVSILAVLAYPALQAQAASGLGSWTTERVLEGITNANGGLSAVEGIRDVRVLGEITADGQTFDFILLKRRPDRIRIAVFFSGMSEETGFDGKVAWKRAQNRAGTRVRVLTDEEFSRENLDTDFDGSLLGDLLPGVTRDLVGIERIDRIDYLKMEVRDQHSRYIHYIDSRTFREFKKEVYLLSEPDKLISTSYSLEYRNHQPIWVAHLVRQEFADGRVRIIRIRSADFNSGILERAFDVPTAD